MLLRDAATTTDWDRLSQPLVLGKQGFCDESGGSVNEGGRGDNEEGGAGMKTRSGIMSQKGEEEYLESRRQR